MSTEFFLFLIIDELYGIAYMINFRICIDKSNLYFFIVKFIPNSLLLLITMDHKIISSKKLYVLKKKTLNKLSLKSNQHHHNFDEKDGGFNLF